MEIVAYYLALISLVTIPATLVAWLLIHPFAAKWRKIRPSGALILISAAVIAVMLGMYYVREPLLGVRFGVKIPLVIVSAILLGVSSYINALVYKQAPKYMVYGLAEISQDHSGMLVTVGIYSKVRHPRFIAMSLAIFAMGLFTNVLAVYILAVVYVPVIILIAFLEDRELAARFGSEFHEYAKDVPGFIPRLGKRDIDP